MIINGKEVNFSITDVNDATRYNDALKILNDAAEKVRAVSDESISVIQIMLTAIRDFFYEAVGEDVLFDVTDVRVAMQHYKAFVEEVSRQGDEMRGILRSIGGAEPVAVPTTTESRPKLYGIEPTERPAKR